MNKLSEYLTAAIMSVVVLSPSSASSDLSVGEDEERDTAAHVLPVLDFRTWPGDAFYESVMSRLDALTKTHSQDRGQVMLDLAELYLSQMLITEAQSFVFAAARIDLEKSDRFFALSDAAKLLRGAPVESFGESPLNDELRQDHALWRSLQALATSDNEMLRQNIDGALLALSFQSDCNMHAPDIARHAF